MEGTGSLVNEIWPESPAVSYPPHFSVKKHLWVLLVGLSLSSMSALIDLVANCIFGSGGTEEKKH
jgi:hypothetical protein